MHKRSEQSENIAGNQQKITAKECAPVNLYPEPENKFNDRAIAFKCFIADGWHRIGYIVKKH